MNNWMRKKKVTHEVLGGKLKKRLSVEISCRYNYEIKKKRIKLKYKNTIPIFSFEFQTSSTARDFLL
jgi:hypothetical protein